MTIQQDEGRSKEFKYRAEGFLTIEQNLPRTAKNCSIGVGVSTDGKVWVCIDGEAFLRFRPSPRGKYAHIPTSADEFAARKEKE